MMQRPARLALGTAASVFDRALRNWVTLRRGQGEAEPRGPSRPRGEPAFGGAGLTDLERAAEHYASLDAAGRLFSPSREIDPWQRARGAGPARARVTDLGWSSIHRCRLDALEPSYRSLHNETAAARYFRAGSGRPVAILVHGYMGGRFGVEQRVWPVRSLLEWGLDVVVLALPFHGVRRSPEHRGAPRFPGTDPRLTVEGFVHVLSDLTDLARWLRRSGHREVGIMGMSLGGYTASLLGTLDPKLAFVVPIVPLASLADFMLEHGHLSSNPAEASKERAALDAVYGAVSPLKRRAQVPGSRVLVLGGRQDQITPVTHARRLAHHFGAPLEVWVGGHVLQFGRTRAFERIRGLLRELEIC